MTRELITEKVKKILGDEQGVDPFECTELANLHDDLNLDSLDKVEFLMACEKEFRLNIGDDEIASLTTFSDVINLLDKNLNG